MMTIDRRTLLTTGLLGAGLLGSTAAQAQTAPPSPLALSPGALPDDTTEIIPLWPKGAPGRLNASLKESVRLNNNNPRARFVTGVVEPRLSVYRPKTPNGAAMLIIPGGGYGFVSIDNEGHSVARFMAERGITAFFLTYRLPAEGWANASDVPVMDAQRGLRLIRAYARDYGVDPARIGVMGFSAGGHLCASLATRYNASVYSQVDQADALSARPFLFAPIYPVISMMPGVTHGGSRQNLIGANPSEATTLTYSPQANITTDTPPAFIVHSENDDVVPVENALLLRAALKKEGIKVETHLYPEGGHGYGIRSPLVPWGENFIHFARRQNLFV